MVNCISLPFYLYVVQQDFEQLSMELLKLDDEVEMRSCDIYIYISSRMIKIARIPSRLTDS